MAPIDNGEEKIERVASDITRSGTQVMIRYVATQTNNLSKAVVAKGLNAASTSLKWTMAAVQKPGGQVSMKELSELPSRTGREVVSLDDKDVMQALEKNLKGRGVHYAIEREKIDGKIEHILHVRGDDAQVVADSLERAAEAVDAKRELKQERSVDREAPKQDRAAKPETAGETESAHAPKQDRAVEQSGKFRMRTGEDSSRELTKSEVLDIIQHSSDSQPSAAGMTDVHNWLNKDLDVDRAIASKWGDQLSASQIKRISDAAERAQKPGTRLDENGQNNRHSPAPSEHAAPSQSDGVAQRQQQGKSTPKPEGAGEKKPAENRPTSANDQKPKEVRQREIREKVKARAEKIKAEAPKPSPKLDAPTPGLKR